jgi:hypothetical protein
MLPGSHCGDHGPRLGSGLHFVILPKPPGELLIGLNRAGAIANSAEELDEATRLAFIVRRERKGPSGPMARSHRFASGFLTPSYRRRGPGRTAFQRDSLLLQPALEFPGAGDVEAVQQIASIQFEGPRRLVGFDCLLELNGVARQFFAIDSHLSIPPTAHNLPAELVPQMAQCLVECPAGVLLVQLGPEKCQERVPAVETVGSSDCEIGQESDALGLGQDGVDVLAVRGSQY